MEKVIALLALIAIVAVCLIAKPQPQKSPYEQEEQRVEEGEIKEREYSEVGEDEITISVNNSIIKVALEENEATEVLKEKLEEGYVVVNANEYGGFEKVGMLGFSLPKSDQQMNVKAGDVVLYQGNQISIFYASNSWNYTKLGRVTNLTSEELKEVLGDGDVMLTLSK